MAIIVADRESSRSRNEVEHGEEMKSPDKRLSAQLRYWRLNHFLNTGFRYYKDHWIVDEVGEKKHIQLQEF